MKEAFVFIACGIAQWLLCECWHHKTQEQSNKFCHVLDYILYNLWWRGTQMNGLFVLL